MQKAKLRAFYSPTQTNKILVAKLLGDPKIEERYQFVIFPEERKDRIARLVDIGASDERFVCLFGNGETHDHSYFIALNRRGMNRQILLKINLDYHDDNESSGPFFATHMNYTRYEKIEIVVPNCESNELSRLHDLIKKAKERGLEFGEKEVAVTIDLDGFTGFPVLPKWMFQNTINIHGAIGVISELGTRILRLDLCGLVEGMTEFTIVPVDLDQPPDIGLLKGFVRKFGNIKPQSVEEAMAVMDICRKPITQEEIDYVGSYSLKAYSRILERFAQVSM